MCSCFVWCCEKVSIGILELFVVVVVVLVGCHQLSCSLVCLKNSLRTCRFHMPFLCPFFDSICGCCRVFFLCVTDKEFGGFGGFYLTGLVAFAELFCGAAEDKEFMERDFICFLLLCVFFLRGKGGSFLG